MKNILSFFSAIILSFVPVQAQVSIIPSNVTTMPILGLTPLCDVYVVPQGGDPVALSFINIQQTGDILNDGTVTGVYYFREVTLNPKTGLEVVGPISQRYRYVSEVKDQIELSVVGTKTRIRQFRVYFALREGDPLITSNFEASLTPVIGSTLGQTTSLVQKSIDFFNWRDIAVIRETPTNWTMNRLVGVNLLSRFRIFYYSSDFDNPEQFALLENPTFEVHIGKGTTSLPIASALKFFLRGPDYTVKNGKQLIGVGVRKIDFKGDYYLVQFVGSLKVPVDDYTPESGLRLDLLANVGRFMANGGTLTPVIVPERLAIIRTESGQEFISGGIASVELDTTSYYIHPKYFPKP